MWSSVCLIMDGYPLYVWSCLLSSLCLILVGYPLNVWSWLGIPSMSDLGWVTSLCLILLDILSMSDLGLVSPLCLILVGYTLYVWSWMITLSMSDLACYPLYVWSWLGILSMSDLGWLSSLCLILDDYPLYVWSWLGILSMSDRVWVSSLCLILVEYPLYVGHSVVILIYHNAYCNMWSFIQYCTYSKLSYSCNIWNMRISYGVYHWLRSFCALPSCETNNNWAMKLLLFTIDCYTSMRRYNEETILIPNRHAWIRR